MSALKRLKTHLLLVDEIAIVQGVDESGDWDVRKEDPRLAADLDWLQDRGVVWGAHASSDATVNIGEVRFSEGRVILSLSSDPATIRLTSSSFPSAPPMRISELLDALFDTCCRLECQRLEESRPVQAISLHPPSARVGRPLGLKSTPGDVLSIVFKAMPEPDWDVSLEDVLEFRDDSQARCSLLGLRKWMGAFSAGSASPGECAQELEWLLHQYEGYMRLHHMKIRKGTLETFITIGAEVAEDLVKIKWGKLPKLLFVASSRKIELMDAEMKAPGREIAYLVRAREHFGTK